MFAQTDYFVHTIAEDCLAPTNLPLGQKIFDYYEQIWETKGKSAKPINILLNNCITLQTFEDNVNVNRRV